MSLWDILVSIFWFMLLVAWFWLLIAIVTDIFRDEKMGGVAKGAWCLFVILLPWLGVLMYLIVRGRSMNERAARQAAEHEKAFQQYVRTAAGPSEPSVADELGKLADLRTRGVISDADYESAKTRVLGGTAPSAMPDEVPRHSVNPV